VTPERHERIVELFLAAAMKHARERDSFLEEACGADIGLRREVEAMLAADEKTFGVLDCAPTDLAANVAASAATSAVGQRLGDYEVLALLGAGGMGEVYLAQDVRLKRKAALKMLPARFTSHPGRLARFEQEALAVSSLNHPNIITIYGIGEQGATRFLATEFVNGRTLRRVIAGDIRGGLLVAVGEQQGMRHSSPVAPSDLNFAISFWSPAATRRPRSTGGRTTFSPSCILAV
jgi:hypothetical protein